RRVAGRGSKVDRRGRRLDAGLARSRDDNGVVTGRALALVLGRLHLTRVGVEGVGRRSRAGRVAEATDAGRVVHDRVAEREAVAVKHHRLNEGDVRATGVDRRGEGERVDLTGRRAGARGGNGADRGARRDAGDDVGTSRAGVHGDVTGSDTARVVR